MEGKKDTIETNNWVERECVRVCVSNNEWENIKK